MGISGGPFREVWDAHDNKGLKHVTVIERRTTHGFREWRVTPRNAAGDLGKIAWDPERRCYMFFTNGVVETSAIDEVLEFAGRMTRDKEARGV